MGPELKIEYYQLCMEYVNDRIHDCKLAMDNAQEAANSNTKSSAGDKYETGRAMMQLERDKAAERLASNLKLKKVMDQIKPDQVHDTVQLGSIVRTKTTDFFISVPLGKVRNGVDKFWAISPVSPVGSLFMGKSKGDRFSFNGREYEVLDLC